MLIVYSHFVMDILHKGHIEMLRNGKAIAGPDGKLILGILTDEAARRDLNKNPIMTFDERVDLARSIKYIDCVVAQYEHSPYNNIRKIKPDVLMQSDSHEPIKEVVYYCNQICCRIVTIPYFPDHSSTQLKAQIRKDKV